MKNIKGSQRIGLTPLNELQDIVLKQLVSPEFGLNPEAIARLKTEVPRAAQLAPQPAPEVRKR
jgi:hypothetical protein